MSTLVAAPGSGAARNYRSVKYYDQRVCVFARLFVCLSAYVSQKAHVQILPNSLYM